MALTPVDYPTLAIYPGTLTDLTVESNWADLYMAAYTIADASRDSSDYPGALIITLSDLTATRLLKQTSTVTISSTGCQTQTLQVSSKSWHEITMEPAAGYKKLYAWNKYTAGMFSEVPDYIYSAEYPVTSNTSMYDASGNLISSTGINLSHTGSDGETVIFADCDDWNSDPFSGGVEE